MSTNEILCLQFGHYSNFVGAHWWNIQEAGFKYDPDVESEINHDVLYREGRTLKGEITFTPRLLLVDLKGSLKSLTQTGDLYRLPEDCSSHVDNVEIQRENANERNTFQKDLEAGTYQVNKLYDLDNEVEVWSDYLYTRFHPRTVNIVNEYQHCNETTPFDVYPLGSNLWKTDQFSEDFADKIRNYIEECNNFHGFQSVFDSTNAFCGLATSCMEYLNDEYASKAILAFPLEINTPSKSKVHLLNSALCFDALSEHSSLFIPSSLPSKKLDFLSYKSKHPYHTSAILASALDTSTLIYRLKKSHHSLLDLCAKFSANGRKAAVASICLPFPLKKNEDLIDYLDKWEGPLYQNLTPNCEISTDKTLNLISLRGVSEARLKRPPHAAVHQRDMAAYQCNSVQEMLNFYMDCSSYGSKTEVVTSQEQMSVPNTFPTFFDNRINHNGDVDLTLVNKSIVSGIKVLSGFHTGSFVGNIFDKLSKELEKVKYKQFHHFSSEGIEHDQMKESFDHILDLRDCYDDNNYLI